MKLTPHELAEKGGITDNALVKQMINDPDAFEATIRQLFDIELIQQCKDLNIKINAIVYNFFYILIIPIINIYL